MPPKTPIIRGQPVTNEKAIRAQELRRAMTPAERKLWERLRAGRLDGWHFRRQQVIEPYIPHSAVIFTQNEEFSRKPLSQGQVKALFLGDQGA